MVSKSYLIFLAILFLNVLEVLAQNKVICGLVTDNEKGESLPNVIVMLKTEDGHAILQYARTDERGRFEMEVSTIQKRLLTFSSMGYESVNVPLVSGKSDYRITLKSKPVRIKEVTVKAPKIRTKGDTIVYNVARYAETQDKTIADVLKRMPGIEVEKNGRISYNGTAINKFYIEGLDMLEGRYGIATNTIPQRDVSTIEVLENHQPVKVLEQIEFSDRAALNVKLKMDAKARWLAIVHAGGGVSPALWKGDLSLMQFSSHGQQIYSYKGNNTGENVSGLHQQLTIEELYGRLSSDYSLPSYLSMRTTKAPNLDENRTLFNKSHTFSGNQLFKLGKDYQLTTRMLYANDRRSSDYASQTKYFLADSLIVTELQNDTRTQTDAMLAEATLQANTEKFYLKNTLGVDLSWHSGNSRSWGTYPNMEDAYSKNIKISNRLQWVKKISCHTLTLTSVNSYEQSPEQLQVLRDESEQFQRIDASAFYTRTTGSYGWQLNPFTLSLNGGVAGVWRSMKSKLNGIPDSLGITQFDTPLRYWHVFASPQLQFQRSSLVMTLDFPFHYYSSLSESHLSPRLYVNWDITSQWTVRLNGQIAFRPTSDSYNYTGLLLRNYRILQQGYTEPKTESTRLLQLTLNYKNPIQALFVNGYVSYLHHRNAFLREQSYLGDYILCSYLPQATKGATYRISGRLSKGMNWWNLVGTFSASYTDSRSQLQQNGIMQPYHLNVFQTQLGMTARPATWISWDYRLAYYYSRIKSPTNYSSANHVNQDLSLSFTFNNQWRLSMSGEHYLNTIVGNQTKSFVLLDADITYNISSHCEIACRLSNLLNQKHYAYTLLGDLTRSYSEYRIRPFNAIVELYYKF